MLTLGFNCVASWTFRQSVSVVLSHLVVVLCSAVLGNQISEDDPLAAVKFHLPCHSSSVLVTPLQCVFYSVVLFSPSYFFPDKPQEVRDFCIFCSL